MKMKIGTKSLSGSKRKIPLHMLITNLKSHPLVLTNNHQMLIFVYHMGCIIHCQLLYAISQSDAMINKLIMVHLQLNKKLF